MTKIDKYGDMTGLNIVGKMDPAEDYFVRMVFPLVLTPERIEKMHAKLRGKEFVYNDLESEFLATDFGAHCVEVYAFPYISALQLLPTTFRNGEEDDLQIIYMIVCESLAKEVFCVEGRGGIPQTPEEARDNLLQANPNLMKTVTQWNLLDYFLDNVSVVFKLWNEYFFPGETKMRDAVFSCFGIGIDYESVQSVLALDNDIG